MSHFITYVFYKDNDEMKNYEELLAPYDECLPCAPYIKYTREQAIAEQRREIEEYRKNIYAKYLSDPIKYEEEHDSKEHIDYLKNEFPKHLTWTDDECYEEMKIWFDDDMVDEDGNLLSTYNPNAKWDWYCVGGRWDGSLVTKEGKKTNEDYVKEIDFDKTPLPFAYVSPVGRWFERGEMGWWGMVSNEKGADEWESKFKKFIKTLDDDVIVVSIDCHI